MIRRLVAGLAASVVFASACTGATTTAGSTRSAAAAPESPMTPPPVAAETAAQALAKLCPSSKPSRPPKGTPERTPKDVKKVEGWVQQARGLKFLHPVTTDAVTPSQMQADLARYLNDPAQNRYLERQGKALALMGAIPPGTDLASAMKEFLSTQVAGYYDPDTGELVFLGKKHLTPLDEFTLSHELTHALDDQHFDLSRFDALSQHCQDEADAAATATTEGSAMASSLAVVLRFFSAGAKAQVVRQGVAAAGRAQVPASVPPFVVRMEEWPYTAGMSFIQYLQSRGGEAAVNAALEHPPATTEQVIHPSLYPTTAPPPVDIPNVALGPGWEDLAVGQVGEEWLSIYLGLRLDAGVAQSAAAGWNGGLYRAWTDGTQVAAILRTVWDTAADAAQFASAMRSFLAKGSEHAVVSQTANAVDVRFGSDERTLTTLTRVSGAPDPAPVG